MRRKEAVMLKVNLSFRDVNEPIAAAKEQAATSCLTLSNVADSLTQSAQICVSVRSHFSPCEEGAKRRLDPGFVNETETFSSSLPHLSLMDICLEDMPSESWSPESVGESRSPESSLWSRGRERDLTRAWGKD